MSGTVSKSSASSGSSSPKISCGSDIDAFSMTSFSVYVEKETDVTFTFGMPDGSSCQFTTMCGTEGTDVSNNQCGGATSVSWSIPDTSDVESCGFGIYSVGFDCNPNTGSSHSTSAVSSSKTAVLSNTIPAQSVTHSTGSASSAVVPPGTTLVSGSNSKSQSSPAISTAAVSTGSISSWSTSTVYATTEVTITSCAPTVTNCPANSHSVVTKTIAISTTIFPVTATETGKATSVSPAETSPVSSASEKGQSTTISTGSAVVATTATVSPAGGNTSPAGIAPGSSSLSSTLPSSSSTSGSSGPESCPSVVPKCINTWLPGTCTDNTDVSCYCPSSNVTSSVISCIQSWSSDSAEESIALSYLTGICSNYISTNPGIVTAIPSTITIAPTPAASAAPSGVSAAGSVGTGAGATTTTAVVGSASQVLPYTTITYSSSTYVVPQVVFTTGVSAATTTVGLVVGTSPVAAATTLATARSSVLGVAGATGFNTPTSTPTHAPYVAAAVPGASISKQGALLTGVIGLLAFFL